MICKYTDIKSIKSFHLRRDVVWRVHVLANVVVDDFDSDASQDVASLAAGQRFAPSGDDDFFSDELSDGRRLVREADGPNVAADWNRLVQLDLKFRLSNFYFNFTVYCNSI